MIHLAFQNINTLFVLSFKKSNNDHIRDYCSKYYMPLVEIEDFNVLIDNKSLFDQPVKAKQEVYEKIIKMLRNDDYATGNLLDYLDHQSYHKSIGIDSSRQANMNIPQQINFTGKLEEGDGATKFFIAEKQQKKKKQF